MALFRKKITQNELINCLLELRYATENFIIKTFSDHFGYSDEDKKTLYEIRIFSLWLISLGTPFSAEVKDSLHDKFCEYLKLDVEIKDFFFEEIDLRYKRYYAAFNNWQKHRDQGFIIGSVINEIIKNKNVDFKIGEKMFGDGLLEAHSGFLVFSSSFEMTLNIIKGLKDEYKIEDFYEKK